MFLLIDMLLVFISNSPGLIEGPYPELLSLKLNSLSHTVSCAVHIYRNNYSSFNSISQSNKNIAFLAFITNYVKMLLQFTELLKITIKPI